MDLNFHFDNLIFHLTPSSCQNVLISLVDDQTPPKLITFPSASAVHFQCKLAHVNVRHAKLRQWIWQIFYLLKILLFFLSCCWYLGLCITASTVFVMLLMCDEVTHLCNGFRERENSENMVLALTKGDMFYFSIHMIIQNAYVSQERACFLISPSIYLHATVTIRKWCQTPDNTRAHFILRGGHGVVSVCLCGGGRYMWHQPGSY